MGDLQKLIATPAIGWTLGFDRPEGRRGALLVMLGNSAPESQPHRFAGVRTPKALAETDNRIATHRLAERR